MLQELLNKLIEKGWKPFGNKKIKDSKTARWNINLLDEEVNKVSKFKDKVAFTNGVLIFDEINLRELVSKESGLWQFVCENGIVGRGDRITKRKKVKDTDSRSGDEVIYYSVIGSYNETDYQYRLIESALCDEDKLEQFLLDNIKIDE